MLARLDAPTTAPAWSSSGVLTECPLTEITAPPPATVAVDVASVGGGGPPVDAEKAKMVLAAMAAALSSEEANLTKWDLIAGDGDCGITLKRGADALAAALFAETLPFTSGPALLVAIADLVSASTGGTSGVLIEIGLRAGASVLREGKGWADAFAAGVAAIKFYGGAELGCESCEPLPPIFISGLGW
jgi:dihydroxyacetone kinase